MKGNARNGEYCSDERHKLKGTKQDDQLLVFGYSCKLFPTGPSMPSEESRLIPHALGGEELFVDRFDCRLHLSAVSSNRSPDTTEPDDEEKACDEERYSDMYAEIVDEKEKERKQYELKKTQIGFNYDRSQTNSPDSDQSEPEPYEVPEGFKLPVGVRQPENMKEHRVIEKTATLVNERGAQMEIFIKAKQHSNETFRFLEFEHPLYPYYKVMLKHMKESRYPVQTPKKATKNKGKQHSSRNKMPSNALAAIAQDHRDSDSGEESEDEGYLHPSLLTAPTKAAEAGDPNTSMIGPLPRPSDEAMAPLKSAQKLSLEFSKNTESVYQLLSDNLPSSHSRNQDGFNKPISDSPEYRQWFKKFYGRDYLAICRPSTSYVRPCHHNILSVIKNAVDYVLTYGARGEEYLKNRPDLNFEFLDPNDKHFMYFQECLFIHHTSKGDDSSGAPDTTLVEANVPLPPSSTNDSSNENANRKRKCKEGDDDITELLEGGSSSDAKAASGVKDEFLQQQRKEKARRFMANILQQKLVEKQAAAQHSSVDSREDSNFAKKKKTDVFERADSPAMKTVSSNVDSMIQIKLQNIGITTASSFQKDDGRLPRSRQAPTGDEGPVHCAASLLSE